MSKWTEEVEKLQKQFPKFKVLRYSDNFFWKFLKRYFLVWAAATTSGYTVYFDDALFETDRGAEILKHEAVHVADYDRWWILFWLSYALLLPTVFTMRAYWEWRGYKETLRSVHEEYKNADPAYREYIMDYYCQFVTKQFIGWNYFFMFPFEKFMYNKCQKFYKSLPL